MHPRSEDCHLAPGPVRANRLATGQYHGVTYGDLRIHVLAAFPDGRSSTWGHAHRGVTVSAWRPHTSSMTLFAAAPGTKPETWALFEQWAARIEAEPEAIARMYEALLMEQAL